MRGSQEWLTKADLERDAAICPSRENLRDKHEGEAAGAFRDRIIWECTKAINSKYNQFAQALTQEAGIANFGTDLASQVLATAASVIDGANTTKKLAAGSALSLGIGSTINKDLFYKQTLPAILASMDAKRSKVLTAIAKAQNEDPDANVYTLARAGIDLDLLQQAGSLAIAVSELTTAAVDNAKKADEERQYAERNLDYGLLQPTSADIDHRVRAAVAAVRKLVADGKAAELRKIIARLGLQARPDASLAILGLTIRDEANEALFKKGAAAQEEQIRTVEIAIAEVQGVTK